MTLNEQGQPLEIFIYHPNGSLMAVESFQTKSISNAQSFPPKPSQEREYYFYIHDEEGRVMFILDEKGTPKNVYLFGPLGTVEYRHESIRNDQLVPGSVYLQRHELYLKKNLAHNPWVNRVLSPHFANRTLLNPYVVSD